ncbi:MAG: type II toxin-antitoxin system death-on-curing family toxin [Anaerolineae bacterium]|nr:type II toxin-antitoxin system death-on-curing family toxin [Anaerolineae bacterium]
MRYLTLSELIYINGAVLDNDKIMTGKQKVRDINLLEAAVQRPAASAFGEDAYPTLREKTAALLHSLARNHPFTDGNKRTAAVAAVFMFAVNGQHVIWDQAEALDTFIAVAKNWLEVPALAAWFTLQECPQSPEPDEACDIAAIRQILMEQKWLLDELQHQ